MFQSINECTDFIFKLTKSTYKGEPLEASRTILEHLGNPHNKTKYIHVAGSNGKGSTVNAAREILMQHGYTVGAFTSPHLERVNERVTINKQPISDEKFLYYTNKLSNIIVQKLEGQYPSFFEMMTLIALLHFADEKVDVAIIETGIGGRVDSTNIITPEVSVITTISLEHTDILGDTIEKIAYEKAGIIKNEKAVVVGVKQPEAVEVIKQKAKSSFSPIYCLGEEIHIESLTAHSFNYKFDHKSINQLNLAMRGLHQIENAALAITTALLFDQSVSQGTIKTALLNAKWEGRFELINPQLIIDGAHNSEGTEALIQTLKELYPNKKFKFVYAALSDKDHEKSIEMMDEVASKMAFTEIQLPRAAKAENLAKQSKHPNIIVNENWVDLIKDEMNLTDQNELLIITGSLYFIAEVRKFLLAKDNE